MLKGIGTRKDHHLNIYIIPVPPKQSESHNQFLFLTKGKIPLSCC